MNLDAVLDIATAPRRTSVHWKQSTITWGELATWVDKPGTTKESGNYLLGLLEPTTVVHKEKPDDPCRNLHRNKRGVVSRSAIALDADYATGDLPALVETVLPYAAIVHTTFSSTPEAPRYRILLPLDRAADPEEYVLIAGVLMDKIGRAFFDPTTDEPERFMFKPSAPEGTALESWVLEGEPVPVDALLEEVDFDLSKRETPRVHPNKRDPFSIEGVVGAFNRAYDFDEVIEFYELPYESVGSNRWHLAGAKSQAGLGLVGDGLVFSHHAKDPASGVACSAFDLVRLHRFGELDDGVPEKTPVNRRPSHEAMLKLASGDRRVMADLIGVDFGELAVDGEDGPSEWKLALTISPRTGRLIDEIANWDLIRANDPAFLGLYFNEMTLAVETDRDLPWRPRTRGGASFSTTDRAAMTLYLEREYKVRPARALVDDLINVTAQQRYVHPVRDYLNALEWDGTPRVEAALPGVRPTDYTRMVARKSLVAAVARIMEPGVKWDHALVLFGSEGLGKSWWIQKMSRGYSATLGRIGDKDTLLTMQRSWIMVSDEGHSLKKADADTQKEFLTRTEDVFRMPYDREAGAHPRHCVIWGTTNDEVFLRRQEGNRRFLIVKCEDKVDFDALTDAYVDQVWAEAVALYRSGERLFLDSLEGTLASTEREKFTEEDALAGVLGAYLDVLVPDEWETMSAESRASWMSSRADGFVPAGTRLQTRTCSAQLWVEALGRRFGDHRRLDLLSITETLQKMPGWEQLPGRHRVPIYGAQVVYRRVEEDLL